MKKQIRYQDAIPEMPDGFYQRMKQTIEGIDEPMNKRHKLTATLAFAIIAILLLAGAAFAATRSGLLDRLFPSGVPQQALELLVTDAATDEKDGLRLTMDEYLFDGRTLHFAWTVSSERAEGVYYLTEYRLDDDLEEAQQEAGGSLGGYGSQEVGDNRLVALGVSANGESTPKTHSGEAGMGYGDILPTKPATLTVTVTAFTTDLSPVILSDLEDPIYFLDEQDEILQRLMENRQIGISQNISSILAYPEFVAARDALLAKGEDWDRAHLEAHAASGLMKPLAQLCVSVSVDPSAAQTVSRTQLKGQREFDLGTHELKVLKVSFEPGATLMAYDVYAKSGTYSDDPRSGERLLITDEQGKVLDTSLSLGMSGSLETDAAGREYLHVERSGEPVTTPPSEIRFVLVTKALLEEAERNTASPNEAYQWVVDHANKEFIASVALTTVN